MVSDQCQRVMCQVRHDAQLTGNLQSAICNSPRREEYIVNRHRPVSVSRIGLRLGVLLAAALAAGCSAPQIPGTAPAGQPLTLTFAFPDDASSSAAATAWLKAYAAVRPEVRITPQPLPAQDYPQQLLGRLDGALPDMFVSLDTQAPALIKRGALLDVSPLLVNDVKLKLDDFQPAGLASWQRGTALYGLPSDLTPAVMFYNRDLFAAAGVAEPAPGWTWDDWLADAQKLTVTSNGQVSRHGTAVGAWTAMVWGNGGELVSADGKRLLLDSPQAAAGVQFAADMVNVHHVAPPPEIAGGPDPAQLFKEQKVAMLPAPSSLASSLMQANLPFKWAIAPFPVGAVAATPLSVAGLSLSARSQNPRAALAFAAWAVGPDGQAATAGIRPFAAPALRAAPARPTGVPGAEAIHQSVAFGRTLPQIERWPEIASAVNEALVPVWKGQATAAAAYARVAPRINEMLLTG
jgi:multiple sugar transport system substrate-binding protein